MVVFAPPLSLVGFGCRGEFADETAWVWHYLEVLLALGPLAPMTIELFELLVFVRPVADGF